MKTIELTQGKVALVDDADFEAANQFKWHAKKRGRKFYAARNVRKLGAGQSTNRLHQFLMPEAGEIDHIDGNGLNNQRQNLRDATHQQNCQAFRLKKEKATSQFRGVTWHEQHQKWMACIQQGGKQIHLGYFSSERDAAIAFDEAARKYRGEFASPNFPA